MTSLNLLSRLGIIFTAGLVLVTVIRFFRGLEIEGYRLSPTYKVLNGQGPTSYHAPAWYRPSNLALPSLRMPPPQLPIIPTQPNPVNLPSYLVKYINKDGVLHTDCIREYMLKEIPRDRIMPSSFNNHGAFANLCNAEDSIPYKQWPF